MTVTESPWHPENEVERLLCSLAGVVSARVVANPLGRLDEIHILASPMFSPKQIVRNVESALSAGLGITIDRRIVSVAQIRRDALEPAAAGLLEGREVEPAEEVKPLRPADGPAKAPATPQAAADARLVFVRYDARSRTHAEAECTVTLERDATTFRGAGVGESTTHGRALAGARAAFAALASACENQDLGLESATTVESNGRTYVLVAARAIDGRRTVALTGVAPIGRSPEEAAILATLQATNRWTDRSC